MANPRVVELRQQTPAAHPVAPRSSQKKRKRPHSTPVQNSGIQSSATGENSAAAANHTKQSKESIQQTKRQRIQRSGKTPRPEDVIVIDSDSEENAAPASATATASASCASSVSARPVRASASAAVMEQLESDDYFAVLGLSRDATDADVKKAYRKLAMQWHPDKNREHSRAEEFFKKIGEAYAVLSDPEKRTQYERYGKPGLNGGSGFSGFSGFSGSPDRASRGSPDDFGFFGPSEFSARRARDIFEAFFGGMDPFAELFSGHMRRASRHHQPQPHGFPVDDFEDPDIGDRGFGPAFVMPVMMGFGGGGMGVSVGFGGMRGFGGGGLLDSFFSDEFPGFGGAAGAGGGRAGGGFSSHSVSTSSFMDRNGQTVTKKTTTTVNPEGRTETVTEEYRNGHLVNSSSTQATSRLAGAGRMQLDGGGGATTPAPSSRDGARRLQSGGRSRVL